MIIENNYGWGTNFNEERNKTNFPTAFPVVNSIIVNSMIRNNFVGCLMVNIFSQGDSIFTVEIGNKK